VTSSAVTYTQKRKDKNMLKKNIIKKFTSVLFVMLAFGCAGADAQPEQAIIKADGAAEAVQPGNVTKKPLVVYYSRTGNARMVANSLASHLEAEIAEIPSQKDRGIFTIMGEQWFWGGDKQKPLEKNLQDYSPIVVVAPIYLMQLSAPGRYFIEEVIPEGSEVYVITTSGGPLAGFTQEGIEELVTESGHRVKGVYGFQAGKTQEEYDKLTLDFLTEQELLSNPAEEAEPLPGQAAGDSKEE
jgi:multimeric flavodoxin WrbA